MGAGTADITNLFLKASTLSERRRGVRTPEEWTDARISNGVLRLKRRVLGFCGQRAEYSLSELASMLVDIGIAGDVDDGRELVPQLNGFAHAYRSPESLQGYGMGLQISRHTSTPSLYTVSVYSIDPSDGSR